MALEASSLGKYTLPIRITQIEHELEPRRSAVRRRRNGGRRRGRRLDRFALPSYQHGIGSVIPERPQPTRPALGRSRLRYVVASPIFTAYLTQVAQMRGTRAGLVNPSLYGMLSNSGYTPYATSTWR